MEGCEHNKADVVDTRLEGDYLVFQLFCRECEADGIFSNHIANVLVHEEVEWDP